MRFFLFIALVVWNLNFHGQHYYYGDLQSLYSLEAEAYKSDSNLHTISKPYNYQVLKKSNSDSVFQNGVWKYSRVLSSDKMTILPVVEFEVQQDPLEKNNFISTGLGAQFNLELNERLSLQTRYLFRVGRVADYYLKSSHYREFVAGLGAQADSNNSYKAHDININLSYIASKHILLSLGKGKNFLGDGYRSLFLSDNAAAYPFIKIESEFWNVKYVNLYSMHQDHYYNPISAKKFSSSHLLSWNIIKNINLSVFESVVWAGKDTLNNRNFDINYLNPIVFFRPIEYSIGSSDNSFLGANLKCKIFKSHVLYGQILFDEFLLKEIRASNGWWANKYAIQVGYKTFDLLNINGLGLQVEYNVVRPYTYSHASSLQNYGHMNQSLAHPLESNFTEFLVRSVYQRGNFSLSLQYHHQVYGSDYLNYNFGGDMFLNYSTRYQDYNNTITQGKLNIVEYVGARFSYMLFPKTNSKIVMSIDYRSKYIQTNISDHLLIGIGIRSNLWNTYADY